MAYSARYYIKWFETIDSTNSALARDKGQLEEKTVYAARYQSAGRGQRGNCWESGRDENLTFSILFRPKEIPAAKQFIISQAVALGVCSFLAEEGIEASIKWPNDIYVRDLKICGILIENTISSAKLSESIVGIGLNLNQKSFVSGARNPISLTVLTGRQYILTETLGRLLRHIDAFCSRLDEASAIEDIDRKYLSRLYRFGEWHNFEEMEPTIVPTEYRSGEQFCGKIVGITETACLRIEKADGSLKEYSFKEIKYIL